MADGLFSLRIESPLGALLAIADAEALVALRFPEDGAEAGNGGNAVTTSIARELRAYFNGEACGFQTPLKPQGSAFEQAVWAELRRVPLAETCSYGDIARVVGGIETARAVGKANNSNPLPIIIPCHRCIGADGALVGYGGGIWRKKWLLRHEGRMRPLGLFAV